MSGSLENPLSMFAHDATVAAGIENGSVRVIPLTRGLVTVVDAEDYNWLNQWKWYVHKKKMDATFYARRRSNVNIGGKRDTINMHREILGLKKYDRVIVDHKNRNGLDNRRNNLRHASPSLNRNNTKVLRNNSSGFRGVDLTWEGANGDTPRRWRVRISANGKRYSCGAYDNAVTAASVYDFHAIKLWGMDTPLNFPEKKGEYERIIRGI